jgi:hypothetical protein
MAHGVICHPTATHSIKQIRSIPRHNGVESDEWSDLGRDPRFVAGWWIIPGIIWAQILIALLIARS